MKRGRLHRNKPQGSKQGNKESLSDLSLIQRVLDRDEDAIAVFLRRMNCVARILRYHNAGYGQPLDEAELEDVGQDTIVAVWRKLSVYSGKVALESWVYQFCHLEFMNRVRLLNRRPHSLSDALDRMERGRPKALPMVQFEEVYQGLKRLSELDASIIRLKHFSELKFEEIARELSLPANTIKSRYYRALEKLRLFLEGSQSSKRPPALEEQSQ